MGPCAENRWKELRNKKGVTLSGKSAQEKTSGWHFFWKNIDGLGRLMRLSLGVLLLAGAHTAEEDTIKYACVLGAGWLFMEGLCRWAPWRALLRHPSKRARLSHYPG